MNSFQAYLKAIAFEEDASDRLEMLVKAQYAFEAGITPKQWLAPGASWENHWYTNPPSERWRKRWEQLDSYGELRTHPIKLVEQPDGTLRLDQIAS